MEASFWPGLPSRAAIWSANFGAENGPFMAFRNRPCKLFFTKSLRSAGPATPHLHKETIDLDPPVSLVQNGYFSHAFGPSSWPNVGVLKI